MKLQENFKAYCDGELQGAERDQVTKHLESNEADRKAVEDLRHLSKAIREYVTRPEPVGLEETLAALEKAQPKARTQQLAWQQLRWIGGAAAVVVCVGFIGMVFFPVFAQSKDAAKRTLAMSSPMSTSDSVAGEANNSARADSSGASASAAAPSTVTRSEARRAMGGPGGFGAGGRMGGAKAKADLPQMNGEINQPAQGLNSDGDQGIPRQTAPATPPLHQSRAPLIQKDATLTVKVKSVAQAQQNIETMAAGLGGFVQQSNRNEGEGQTGTATLVLRIPVREFDQALKEIRSLGDVVSDSSNGNDVTSDVVDMEARLKVLRAEESDYLVLLGRARRTGEIMEIRDKLTEIRTDIESITSQRNVAKDMAAYSTINVTLEQRPAVGQSSKQEGQDTWLNDTWATAVNGLSSAGKVIAQLFIFVLVWSPIWVPVALIGAWIYRKVKW